jgi:hypothetical protein
VPSSGGDPHRLLHGRPAGVRLNAPATPAAAQRPALADAEVTELSRPTERTDVGPPVQDQAPSGASAPPDAEHEPGALRRAGNPFPYRPDVRIVSHGHGPVQPLTQQRGHRHRPVEPG